MGEAFEVVQVWFVKRHAPEISVGGGLVSRGSFVGLLPFRHLAQNEERDRHATEPDRLAVDPFGFHLDGASVDADGDRGTEGKFIHLFGHGALK